MALPHIEKAKHQHYETGLDVEPSGHAKDWETEKTPGGVTLRRTSRKRAELETRTGEVGEMLCMAYAPGGTKGLSK